MYFPTPAEAALNLTATVLPNDVKSYLDLATTASNAANALEKKLDSFDDEKRMKAAAYIKNARKRANQYVELYMSGLEHNPMPKV
jgi:hypothetical protein